jgi:hypothetical protein
MKYLLCVFLAFATVKSYSQLSLNEMLAVYKMNLDQFEIFALKKGYYFSKIKDTEDTFGASYVKGKEENTKYITLYTKFFDVGRCVTYQTSINSELISFREQMKNLGFILISTKNSDGALVKTYKKDKRTINIYSINEDDLIAYEISLEQEN